jgi:hypothetical protein
MSEHSSNTPLGWGNRNNRMSEHDIKLGGIAATKFASKNSYDGASTISYNTSDQVRDYYMNDFQRPGDGGQQVAAHPSSNLPDLWAERQKERDSQGKQMGVFSRDPPTENQSLSTVVPSTPSKDEFGDVLAPEVALVQIATHTLETMAKALEHKSNVKIPMAERAAFANALKQAMDTLAKQSS